MISKEEKLAYRQEWKKRNQDKISEYNRAYRLANLEEIISRQKLNYNNGGKEKAQEYREANREQVNKVVKDYYYRYHDQYLAKLKIKRQLLTEKAKRNKYQRERRKNDPHYRVYMNMSRYIRLTLTGKKAGRSWQKLVGYSIDELKSHLEFQFNNNMSWENYGSYWHIDHIQPVCSFNFETEEDQEFKDCWKLKNLRPLLAIENIKKAKEDRKLKKCIARL